MNYYSHRINDYRGKTAHLTLLEHGVYRQLLDTYYDSESPIPTETEVVFRRLSARTEEDKNAVISVLKDFFTLTDGGWIHQVCDEIIAEYHQKADVARANGQRGGRPAKPRKTQPVNFDNPEITGSKANQEPLTINQEPIKKTVAPKAQPTPKLSDAEWLESLKGLYPHIDIEQESRKMDAWLSTRRGKQKTRRFVVNWLNRNDAPLQPQASTSPWASAF